MSSVVIRMMGKGERTFPLGVIATDIATSFGVKKSEDLIGLRIGSTLLDLQSPVSNGGNASPIYLSDDSPDARYFYWHSFSHIMAQAVKCLYPGGKLGIGLVVESGFYYDFEIEEPFTLEDLSAIEEEMKRIVLADLPFERMQVTPDEARSLLTQSKETLKLELLDELLLRGEDVYFYKDGDFVDMCVGPHVHSTKLVGYFKLLDIASVYWRGDERRQMLQRVYATAFLRKDDLTVYLASIEEAKKRDHRKLGRELDLFSVNDEVGPGLLLWHPRGVIIRQVIEDYYRKRHREAGYDFVHTPHIGKCGLWEASGHLDFYRDSMFPSMFPAMEVEGEKYYLKPMNCPFHVQIYKSKLRSYRELPVRFAEWGTVYRLEASGMLHGATRLRGFTQDDAHLFCSREQVAEEIDRVLEFCIEMLNDFGLCDFHFYLTSRPEKRVGSDDDWCTAEQALRDALERSGELFSTSGGDGVFYGPKIDICVKDALGRQWQISTIQFDFNLPKAFGLTYIGEDGREHQPFMLHRALLGSIERFFAIIVEHYAGHFPLWLAPVQVVVLPISQTHNEYSQGIVKQLEQAGLRCEVDSSNNTLNYRIRAAQKMKAPYMIIIGDKEMASGALAVRVGSGETSDFASKSAFLEYVGEVLSIGGVKKETPCEVNVRKGIRETLIDWSIGVENK